jgi:hypothetical protein
MPCQTAGRHHRIWIMPDRIDKRAKIEIQLATYLEIAMISVDEETLKYVRDQIADLERRMKQLDDADRRS